VDYYKLIPSLAYAWEAILDSENEVHKQRIIEVCDEDFDVSSIQQTFTHRQLKDISKKLLNVVKLRPLSDKGDVEISLPNDDLVLLATRPMEHNKVSLASSRKIPTADDEDARNHALMREAAKQSSVLQILHSSYTPSELILCIVDESDESRVVDYTRQLEISVARSELYKSSGVMKENLSGIKKLLNVTDDPGNDSTPRF